MTDTPKPPSARSATAIDNYVGQRLKTRRKACGLSQEKLANMLGISFQQLQKYERGFNRVSAGRLYTLAGILGVKIDYFYDGLPPIDPALMHLGDVDNVADLLAVPESLPMLRIFAKLAAYFAKKPHSLLNYWVRDANH